MLELHEQSKKKIKLSFLIDLILIIFFSIASILLPFIFEGFHGKIFFSLKIQIPIFLFIQSVVLQISLIHIKIKRRLIRKMNLDNSFYAFITFNGHETIVSKKEILRVIKKRDYYMDKFLNGNYIFWLSHKKYEYVVIEHQSKKFYVISNLFKDPVNVLQFLIKLNNTVIT